MPGSLINKIVNRFLPDPGQGPDKEARENGFFNIVLWGKNSAGKVIRTRVKGDRDPGYGSTSKMIAESTVSLAIDDLNKNYGVLTPVTAIGDPLLKRLQENAGLTFKIDHIDE